MKIQYQDSHALMAPHVHGRHAKDLAVLHETVSPDYPGWTDINGVEQYLAAKGYGIHGLTDAEGHKAWAYGLGNAVFWQCGGVNERSIGIEQVSRVMLQAPTNAARRLLWAARQKELRATAQLLAGWHNAMPKLRPLVFSLGHTPGVTGHWCVSQWAPASEGHTDCWPVHLGGYYPILSVIRVARTYAAAGYHF